MSTFGAEIPAAYIGGYLLWILEYKIFLHGPQKSVMTWLHDAFRRELPRTRILVVDAHSTHSKIVFGEVRLSSGFLFGICINEFIKTLQFPNSFAVRTARMKRTSYR